MNLQILALVLTISLAENLLVLGLRKVEKKVHHASKTANNKSHFRSSQSDLQERKRTFGTLKKLTSLKSASFSAGNKKETVQNELLVKELALSSDILEDKRSQKASSKKQFISHRRHQTGRTTRRDAIAPPSISESVSRKPTSMALLSGQSGKAASEKTLPISRTLLTAIGLLFDERNHFEKDSNALTLAKVLLDKDKNVIAKHTTQGPDSLNMAAQLGGLSRVLRFLNASLSQESPGGERKSTIHTELINPTELGVSILRLLFGHKATLVMKPAYKTFHNNPTSRILSASNPVASSPRRKQHKKSFSFALAKAVSDLIKSMAKEELKNYLQKMPNRQVKSPALPQRYWPLHKKVDVQGNRKSWVLLKIPKSGEEAAPQQTMEDQPLYEKETDVEKSNAGIVDTLGKLNDADPQPTENNEKNREGHSKNEMNDDDQRYPGDVKGRPTGRVGYSVRILPSLKGSAIKLPEITAKQPQSVAPTTAAFAEAVQKLLKAVQSSIKTLQSKQFIGHPQNIGSKVTDKPQHAVSDPLASIVSDQPKAEKTNTGNVRAMRNDPTAMNEVQLSQKQPVLAKKLSGLGEVSAFTRAAAPTEHENAIFDPFKDLEPITKSISPTKRLGPSGNVLFESATELGTPRNTQQTSTADHIQEDLEAFAEKSLQAHNHLREEHHAPKLRWSDELATEAERLAYDMAMKGAVERSEVATAMGFGENVAKITGVPFNDAGSVATNVWYSESSNYSYSYPRVTPQTDAFTQMVWRDTKEIGMGCAKDVATNDLYVVALYRPPGNDRRRLRENVLNKGRTTEDVYATIFKRTQ